MKYHLYLIGPKSYVYWIDNPSKGLEEVFETTNRTYIRNTGEKLVTSNCIRLTAYPEKLRKTRIG